MKYSLALVLLSALPASAQFLTFGVKAGVPLTDAFSTGNGENLDTSSYQRRFIIGPTVELHFFPRLAFEFDALYRRDGFHYVSSTPTLSGPQTSSGNVAVNDWQFPFLGKFFLRGGALRPFIDAGLTYRHIANANNDPDTGGFTIGGGLNLRLLMLRISPEIRYVHWGTPAYDLGEGVLVSSSNQVDFLLGVTF